MDVGWATFAATLVTALATAALVWATWVLARVTTHTYQGSKQANVVAVLKPSRWSAIHINIHIVNTGPAPAFDVDIDVELRTKDGETVPPDHGYWKRLEVITPKDEFISYLTSAPAILGGTISVNVSWTLAPGLQTRIERKLVIDTRNWEHVAMELGGDPLVQIAQETKKIREDLHRILTGFNRLKVDSFTSEDRASLVKIEREKWKKCTS